MKNKRAILAAPLLFWSLVAAYDVVGGDPEPWEEPLVGLVGAYLYYGPIFFAAALLQMGAIRTGVLAPPSKWRRMTALFCGALASLAFLLVAHFVVRLPLVAWPFVAFVGGLMGMAIGIHSPNNSMQPTAPRRG